MEAQDRSDVAALGAGVVAVAVSVLFDAGPFDLAGFLVAVTLTIVIVAYVWPHDREDWRKSAAIAAMLASAAMPIFGFVLELYFSPPVANHFVHWPERT